MSTIKNNLANSTPLSLNHNLKDLLSDPEEIKAHSNILKAGILYFKVPFSNNWIKRFESGMILFEKNNISPKIFKIVLL